MPIRVLLFGPPRLEVETFRRNVSTIDARPLPRARGRALLAYLGATVNVVPNVHVVSNVHVVPNVHTRDALAALRPPK